MKNKNKKKPKNPQKMYVLFRQYTTVSTDFKKIILSTAKHWNLSFFKAL